MNLYTHTLKYMSLAVAHFLPSLQDAASMAKDAKKKAQLNDDIEMYSDIKAKIDRLGLNYSDPNRIFPGEEWESPIDLTEDALQHMSRLVQNLLIDWKQELSALEAKQYRSEKAKARVATLNSLIDPLQALSGQGVLGKYAALGPLELLTEDTHTRNQEIVPGSSIMFPAELISKLPSDIAQLCEEFNFVFQNKKPLAGMLLLRRILPLSIVRVFQRLNRESEIKDAQGEYLETKPLLGKVEGVLQDKRIYSDLMGYKPLVDASQHSYALTIQMTDVVGASVVIRLFLDHIFKTP